MSILRYVECPDCDGAGRIAVYYGIKHPTDAEPDSRPCSACIGSGVVELEDDEDEFDDDGLDLFEGDDLFAEVRA